MKVQYQIALVILLYTSVALSTSIPPCFKIDEMFRPDLITLENLHCDKNGYCDFFISSPQKLEDQDNPVFSLLLGSLEKPNLFAYLGDRYIAGHISYLRTMIIKVTYHSGNECGLWSTIELKHNEAFNSKVTPIKKNGEKKRN